MLHILFLYNFLQIFNYFLHVTLNFHIFYQLFIYVKTQAFCIVTFNIYSHFVVSLNIENLLTDFVYLIDILLPSHSSSDILLILKFEL